MKKIILAVAFVAICSVGSAVAQAPVTTTKAKPASEQAEPKKESKPASCCSAKGASSAKACSHEEKAAGKSSCCQKGHTDAKVETTEDKKKD